MCFDTVPKSRSLGHKYENCGEPLKYDPTFNGPLTKRSCTDVICLIIFIVFVGCWIGIGIYAFSKGNTDIFDCPTDSDGNKCGFDSSVRDQPYLLYFDLAKCALPTVPFTGCQTKKVCVKECPKNSFSYTFEQHKSVNELKNSLYCTNNVDKSLLTTKGRIQSEIDRGRCTSWYLLSIPVFNRCIYNVLPSSETFSPMKPSELIPIVERIKSVLSWIVLIAQNTVNYFFDDPNLEQTANTIVEDLAKSIVQIVIGLILAFVFCLLFIILMRWISGVMVWVSIVGVIGALSYCIYLTASRYAYLKNHDPPPENEGSFKQYLAVKETWLTLLIICSILLSIIVLAIIFLRKRIVIAIALIEEASKAVGSVKSTLFFPIFPWAAQVGVIVYAVFTIIYLTSIGEKEYRINGAVDGSICRCPLILNYNNGTVCDPDIFKNQCSGCGTATQCAYEAIVTPTYIKIFHAINIIGLFWGTFFISALGEMILAATFATWYWTYRKRDVPFFTLTISIGRTFRYHLGTLAFGSLIITICRLIRVAIEYLEYQLSDAQNAFTKALFCLFKCFFWMLENFLRFINRNAYVMCAVHGKNFCTSAKDAFNLLMRNVIRVVVLDKITDFLFFLSKLLITAAVGVISYFIFTSYKKELYMEDVQYDLTPIIIITVGAYLISTVFFGVYAMAVDTLFLCFLEDCERNDGSREKPYFMSKQLMKILEKKNR